MARPYIAVFDTETTGLTLHPEADLRKQPKCIEFGGVILSGKTGKVIHEVNWLIWPCEDVTEEITKITGITNEQLAGQPTFGESWPRIAEFFTRAGAVMAHNLPFDKAMIQNDCKRNDIVLDCWPKIELCTVGVYKESWGRNPRLKELYPAVTGKTFEQKHRALDDVMHLVEIIQHDGLWELV